MNSPFETNTVPVYINLCKS